MFGRFRIGHVGGRTALEQHARIDPEQRRSEEDDQPETCPPRRAPRDVGMPRGRKSPSHRAAAAILDVLASATKLPAHGALLQVPDEPSELATRDASLSTGARAHHARLRSATGGRAARASDVHSRRRAAPYRERIALWTTGPPEQHGRSVGLVELAPRERRQAIRRRGAEVSPQSRSTAPSPRARRSPAHALQG